MLETILVPTDGSPGAEATIDHAIELATTHGAAVHALSVVDAPTGPTTLTADERDGLTDESRQRGRQMTIRISDRAEDAGLDAARSVREGIAHEEIRAYADEHDVDLIVMGTHGRTGVDHARLGSTTERVLTLADVPVLSVRLTDDGAESDLGESGYDRIVIPTDGSDAAERAADRAFDLAEGYGADVRIVYVVDTTTYALEDTPRSIIGLLTEGGQKATESIATMARDRGLEAATTVRRGTPTDELLAYADGVDADLLAMGTRGRTVGEGRLLGSTTARVVRRSPIPVLTVG